MSVIFDSFRHSPNGQLCVYVYTQLKMILVMWLHPVMILDGGDEPGQIYSPFMCADTGGLRNIWFIFDSFHKTKIYLRENLIVLNRNLLNIAQVK